MSPETEADLSDKGWDDLIEADYAMLRDRATETDHVRGDGSKEAIVAGLLASEGRADEVPDEYEGEIPDDLLDGDESDDGAEDDASDDEDDEPAVEFQTASEYEPAQDDSFIIEAGPLQEWIDHIDAMVDEAKIHITFDGLWTKAVDPANVGMVRAEQYAAGFDSYDVPDEGVIGVNMVRLKGVLSGADAGQLVHISYNATTNNLVVRFGGHEFTIALIDPASIRQEPDLPDLDLPATVEVEVGDFKDAVRYADEVTDHMSLTVDPDGSFLVYAEGDTDDYTREYDQHDDDGVYELVDRPHDEVSSLFSLDYLKSAVKAYDDDSDKLKINLGMEMPVIIRGDVNADDTRVGESTYMIAPRIQAN